MEQEKEVKDLLQGHFASFEAEPDRDVWAGIAAGLHAESPPPRRKMIPLWTRYAAAVAASLLLLMGLVWMLRTPDQGLEGKLAEQPVQQDVNAPGAPQEDFREEGQTPDPEYFAEDEHREMDAREEQQVYRVAQQSGQAEQEEVAGSAEEQSPAQHTPDRRPRPGLQAMTPLHRQVGIRHEMRETLANNAVPSRVQPRQEKRNPAGSSPARDTQVSGKRNELNLNELTLANAVSFATNELSKWADSPVEIYTEETPEREVRTYEFDLLSLRITRKVHRRD